MRYKWLWLAIGFSLIAAIFAGSIMDIPIEVKRFVLQDKVMHMSVYACLMGWFAQIYRHDLTRLFLVITFISMGIVIEFLQSMTATRQFELLDMIANTSGVVLAWALGYTWFGSLLSRLERLLGVTNSA